MKTKITIGIALLAVAAMLFAGIAAGAGNTATVIKTLDRAWNTESNTTKEDFPTLTVTGFYNVGDEYIILTNMGNEPVNLDGWVIKTLNGGRFTIPGAVIGPKEEVPIYFGDIEAQHKGIFIRSKVNDAIDDRADTITLWDPTGVIASAIAFTTFGAIYSDDRMSDESDSSVLTSVFADAISGVSATGASATYDSTAGVSLANSDSASPATSGTSG